MEITLNFETKDLFDMLKSEIQAEIDNQLRVNIRRILLDMPEVRKYIEDASKLVDINKFIKESVILAVQSVSFMPFEEIKKDTNKTQYVSARNCYMYYMRKLTNMSLGDIGAEFGKDHSTVLNSLKRCEDALFVKDKKHVLYLYLISAGVLIEKSLKDRGIAFIL